jgi:uncharacterized protein YcaQ
MLDNIPGWFNNYHWIAEHPETIEQVRAHIRANGGVRSSELGEKRSKANGWWDWKHEKIALESLYNIGELMIARREKFQRVYDLRERVMPGWDDANTPDEETTLDAHAIESVRVLGAAIPAWVPDYLRIPKKGIAARLERLAHTGAL